jgi:lysophospholipase L1-like esterase
MKWLSWLGSLLSGIPRATRRTLEVEALEDRCLLTGPGNLAAIPMPILGVNDYWNARELVNNYWSQQGHAHIVFLGDSIVDDYAGTGLPFWNAFIAPLGAANFGVKGFTTSQVLWQVASGEVAALTPDVVVLQVGTNNLGAGQYPWDVAEGIGAIINGLRAELPHTQIVVAGILPRGQSAYDPFRLWVSYTNYLISQYADNVHVRYVDFGSLYLLPDGTMWSALTTDYIHPNFIGYGLYTEGLYAMLPQALAAAAADPLTAATLMQQNQ